MPPRKKAAPVDTDPHATQDPPTTRTVRSSARLTSQAIAAAANSNSTIDGATSSKPASKSKTKAAPKPKPASKTTKQPSKVGSKRTKADAGDDEDTPPSKKPKTRAIDEEEEDDMDLDTKDDKKMVTSTSC